MPRPEKVAEVDRIAEKLREAQGAVVTDYRGLNVKSITELRRRLRAEGVEYRVVKNTLTKLAAEKVELSDLGEYLTGPTAIAFGYDDPVAPARIIAGFARESRVLTIKGGIVDGQVIDAAAVGELAELPSREVLLARVVGGMQAPISGLVNVLQGNIRSLVYALDALRRQRESA